MLFLTPKHGIAKAFGLEELARSTLVSLIVSSWNPEKYYCVGNNCQEGINPKELQTQQRKERL